MSRSVRGLVPLTASVNLPSAASDLARTRARWDARRPPRCETASRLSRIITALLLMLSLTAFSSIAPRTIGQAHAHQVDQGAAFDKALLTVADEANVAASDLGDGDHLHATQTSDLADLLCCGSLSCHVFVRPVEVGMERPPGDIERLPVSVHRALERASRESLDRPPRSA